MKQEIKTELYASPEVEVIEVNAQQVICQSDPNLRYGGFSNEEEEGY